MWFSFSNILIGPEIMDFIHFMTKTETTFIKCVCLPSVIVPLRLKVHAHAGSGIIMYDYLALNLALLNTKLNIRGVDNGRRSSLWTLWRRFWSDWSVYFTDSV